MQKQHLFIMVNRLWKEEKERLERVELEFGSGVMRVSFSALSLFVGLLIMETLEHRNNRD